MKVNTTDEALTDANFATLNNIQPGPEAPKEPEDLKFGPGEVFHSGQFKYNPLWHVVPKMRDWIREEDTTLQGYSPYDNPENIAGYPADLFVGSYGPEDDAQRKESYDQSLYLNRVNEYSGGGGLASDVVAGVMNPLYMIPAIRGAGWMRGMIQGGAGEVATEGLYQAANLDELRTAQESAINITVGAMAGGVLNRLINGGHVSASVLDEVEPKLRKEIDSIIQDESYDFVGPRQPPQPPPPEGSKAADLQDPGRLNTLSRIPAILTPMRTLSSPSSVVRRISAALGEQNVFGTAQAAVETRVKQYNGMLSKGMEDMLSNFKAYRKLNNGGMKYSQFQEQVARAMRNGDVHDLPEVQKTAQSLRRTIMEPVRKLAKEYGIYGSDEDLAKFATSYLPRMYNFPKMARNPQDFKRVIQEYLRQTNPDIADEAIIEAADEVSYAIRHTFDPNNAMSANRAFKAKALKGRTVAIPDNVLNDFLVNDLEVLFRSWTHNMATNIEMTRKFGDTTLDDLVKEAEMDWQRIIDETESAAKRTKYDRQKLRDVQDIRGMRDRLFARYAMPDNPSSSLVRAGRAARNLGMVRSLGGMTLSSLPDLARPLYRHHLRDLGKSAFKLISDPDFRKMSRAEMHRIGAGTEMTLHSRMSAITEAEYIPAPGKGGFIDGAENALESMARGTQNSRLDFGRVSLMSPWNESLKLLAFNMEQDALIRAFGQNVKNSKLLKRAGFDEDMVSRIKGQLAEHGGKNGPIRIANFDEWTDYGAADALESFLMKQVDSTIVTPGIMDRPLFMSNEAGKLIAFAQSFAFSSTNRQLIAGLNNFDGMFIQGISAATMMGALAWYFRTALYNPDYLDSLELTPEMLLVEGINYSGVMGFGQRLVEMGHASWKISQGEDYRAKRLDELMFGLPLGLSRDVQSAINVAFGDKPSEKDVRAMFRLMPYNNLFYVDKIFEAAEKATADAVGAK